MAYFGKLKNSGGKYLGIDIGSHTIKIVELHTSARGIELLNHAVAPTPPGGFQIQVLAAQLSEMLQEQGIKTRRAVVGMSGRGVAVRRLSLPPIPEKEIPEALRWQAGDQFPFSMEDALVAFQLLPGSGDSDKPKMELLVAAATREAVEEHVEVLQEADMECVGLVAEMHAVEQFWQRADLGLDEDGAVAVIDLGASKTGIHIFRGGQLEFSRQVPTAGDSFTDALTGMFRFGETEAEVSATRAEELKLEYGITTESEQGSTDEDLPLSQLAVKIRPVLEKLETEISRSFDYYAFQFQGTTISRLMLAGGGSRLREIDSFLADRFDINVTYLDPLVAILDPNSPAFLEVDAESRPALSVAVGLALPTRSRFNLLPADLEQRRRRWTVGGPVAYATLGLVLLLPAAQYVWQAEARISSIRQAAKQREDAFGKYQKIFEEYQKIEEKRRQLDRKLAKLPRVDTRRPQVAAALRVISQKIPEQLTVTKLDVVGSQSTGGLVLRMKGLIFGPKEDSFTALTTFMGHLEKAPVFSEVQLSSADSENASEMATLGFEIVCGLKTRN